MGYRIFEIDGIFYAVEYDERKTNITIDMRRDKNMKANIDKFFEIADKYNFSVHKYDENNIVCGYELSGYTNRDVNMIVFIDLRKQIRDKGYFDFEDIVKEFWETWQGFDIDYEVDIHRQNKEYRNDFTLRESLEDFEDFDKDLEKIFNELYKVSKTMKTEG